MTTQEIVDTLSKYSNKFPREAFSEAPQHREELIPYLLDALDYACDNGGKIKAEETKYNLYFYAIFLLAQFREKQAFPKLVRLLRIDKDILGFLLGDALTESVNRCLYSVYDGNLGLLKELIEDTNAEEFARDAALDAFAYIARDGRISREEMVEYFRYLIYERLVNDTSIVPTSISSCVIDEHLFEMISDVKFLYDKGLIDHMMNGGYDSFIDHIFSYPDYKNKTIDEILINDVIKELENWAVYNEEEPKPMPSPKPEKKLIPSETKLQSADTKKKIGRNDPCPCGSGKKYKKCCLNKGIKLINKEEDDDDDEDDDRKLVDLFREMKMEYEKNPYDLLKYYPSLAPSADDGKRTITEFYNSKAIKIDIPVYKALCHREIPIYIKRDHFKEDMERIDFLLEAFTLFNKTCDEEYLKTFEDFDRKYMVHYESEYWVYELSRLLDEYKDDISNEKLNMRENVKAVLDRMAA